MLTYHQAGTVNQMKLDDIYDLVASLFIMLNKKTYILLRIEFLVGVVMALFLALFITDIFRRHFHSSMMKAVFSLFGVISDSIFIYLLGAMQTAPFKNELFPVWAIVLIIFYCSVDFISGYGVPDPYRARFAELRTVMNLLAASIFNLTHGSRFPQSIWSLWALQMLRSLYRFMSRDLAFNSAWHGGSSQLISEYMRTDHDPKNWIPEECNPGTMAGYKYLVYGERSKLQKPRYVMRIATSPRHNWLGLRHRHRRDQGHGSSTSSNTTIRSSSFITLDMIWGCRRHLLRPILNPNETGGADKNTPGNDLKDLSLAFALSRLLRCRLEDATTTPMLQGGICHINRKLVMARIIGERDVERAFMIMELQLTFVNDYFNTRYPMVFCSGLSSLFSSLLQSVAIIGVICWLSVDIHKVYKPPDGELAHVLHGRNIEVIITWLFMGFVVFKEIWEMVIYLLSDWTRLLLVCMYANQDGEQVRNHCMEKLVLFFFRSSINPKKSHGLLDQYVFVESYDDRPKFWNLISKVTTGLLPKKDDGAKLGSAIKVPEYVKPQVLGKLRTILNLEGICTQDDLTETPANTTQRYYFEETVNTGACCLPKFITTLSNGSSDRMDRYGWACFSLPTSSHVILVWHIATSICEMALAKKHGVDLRKPGFLRSLVSCFSGYCSSKPYLIDVDEQRRKKKKKKKKNKDINPGFACSLLSHITGWCSSKSEEEEKNKLTEELRKDYIIANSLSRYCTYLLVSKPELIPGSFLEPQLVFQETVKSARDGILKGCDSLESRYSKLKEEAEKAVQDSDLIKMGDDVVRQGTILAKELLDHEGEESCWAILAGVWTELLVHIAPTQNAKEHKACLESGGEFITNIWALLCHCGIEKSSLWPEDDASDDDDDPAIPQGTNTGNNNNSSSSSNNDNDSHADWVQQAGVDASDHHIGIDIREGNEIEGTKEIEVGSTKTGTGEIEIEGTGSIDVEEISQDTAVEGTNVYTCMAGQKQEKGQRHC